MIENEAKDTSSVEICKMVTSLYAVDVLNCTEKVIESEFEDGVRSDSSSLSDSSSYFDNSADLASMPDAVDEEPLLGKPGETIKQVSLSPELASSQTKQLVSLIEKFKKIFSENQITVNRGSVKVAPVQLMPVIDFLFHKVATDFVKVLSWIHQHLTPRVCRRILSCSVCQ